jgi:hypothetical protein
LGLFCLKTRVKTKKIDKKMQFFYFLFKLILEQTCFSKEKWKTPYLGGFFWLKSIKYYI